MAYIEGIIDCEQLDQLVEAGYEIVSQEPKHDDAEIYGVRVFVDCDVNDLLSPPLCKQCGTDMGDGYHEPVQKGYLHQWVCPNCGTVENEEVHYG